MKVDTYAQVLAQVEAYLSQALQGLQILEDAEANGRWHIEVDAVTGVLVRLESSHRAEVRPSGPLGAIPGLASEDVASIPKKAGHSAPGGRGRGPS